jgi:hypothetical protein
MIHCPYCGRDFVASLAGCPHCRAARRRRELRDGARIGAVVFAVVAAAGAAASALAPHLGIVGAVAIAAAVVVVLMHRWKGAQVEMLRALGHETADGHALTVLSTASTIGPLPWSEWALRPTAILDVLSALRQEDRRIVVECGAGLSTLFIAEQLLRRGHGHIYAFEHNVEWCRVVEGLLREHKLDDVATVIHAPLEQARVDGRPCVWYAAAALEPLAALPTIDLLLVDGPPGSVGPLARYPALPRFWDKLTERSLVLLDDGDRADERQIVEDWRRRYPVTAQYVANTRGLWTIARRPERAVSADV